MELNCLIGSLITSLFTFVYLHLCCLCGPYQNNNKPSLLLFWSRPRRQHKCKQTNVNKDVIKLPSNWRGMKVYALTSTCTTTTTTCTSITTTTNITTILVSVGVFVYICNCYCCLCF